MGRMAVVLVIGLAVILGIIGNAMYSREADANASNASYYEKTQARNIAMSGVDMYINKYKGNVSNAPMSFSTSMSDLGGSARMTLQPRSTVDSLELVCVGTYKNATHTIRGVIVSSLAGMPQVDGAVGVSFTSKAKIGLSKGSYIDGNSHDINGNAGGGCAAVPGVAVGNPNQTMPDTVLYLTDNKLQYGKDVQVKGKNATLIPDIEVQPPQDYYAWSRRMIQMADAKYLNKVSSNSIDTLGTKTHPQITYFDGKTKLNNVVGFGVLIVDGSLSCKDIQFTGLILCMGDSLTNEKVNMGGNSKIIGALMVSGKKTSVKVGGADILYSCDAIEQGMDLLRSRASFAVASWFE